MGIDNLFQDDGLKRDLALIQLILEPHLESHLKRRLECSINPIPQKLYEAMSYGVLEGGKRLRAYLFLAALRLFSGSVHDKVLLDICCSIECLQAYSLIHDDLPGMDNSDLRRGKPSTHKAFDHHTAILAGSSLQNLAFEILSRLDLDAKKRCALIEVMSVATGPQGMMAGQQLDMDYELFNPDVSQKNIERMQYLKTASFFQGVLQSACIVFGADQNCLNEFGKLFGRLFQITDDMLDVTSSREKLGKPTQNDNDKKTLITELGLEGAHQECKTLKRKAQVILKSCGTDSKPLITLMNFLITRSS